MIFTYAFECSNIQTFEFAHVMLWILPLLYTIICLLFVCYSHLNMLVAGKRTYNHKSLPWRCQTLKDLEKRMSNKNVTSKYGTSNNTFSTWVKSTEKLLDSLEKGSNIKRQKLKIGDFEMVDNFQLVPKYANKMFHYQLSWFKRRHWESPNN